MSQVRTPFAMHQASHAMAPEPRLSEVELCVWVSQAAPGDTLEYHRGFLAVDRTPYGQFMDTPARAALELLADRAHALAEQELVHLVQRRCGPFDFSYLAIARPKPKHGPAALSTLMFKEAA